MRKLIVKNFALDYFGNLFGWKFNAPRASRIIFPLFVITGILIAFFTPNWPTPTFILSILYLLDVIALFFGFVYFRINPIKWDELDEEQKLQYGLFENGSKLTKEQEKEWLKIYKKYNS